MNFNNQIGGEGGAGNGRFFMFVGAFLAIMLVAGGSYFTWNKYFSAEAKTQRNYQKYVDWQANYEKAMKEDTYGGKTPQETLDMFVAALRAGDVELASKYFMLDTNENSENYLTRREWEDGLRKAKEGQELKSIVSEINNMKPSIRITGSSDIFEYVLLGEDEVIDRSLILKLNKYSNIWK